MDKQKKIMLLGGISYLLPVIEAAHQQGYYVITADYLPNNIAHHYSDEYCNVSIVEPTAVLRIAQAKQIDGIISFGVDPGVVSAAYVQEQMGLPSMGPYESVKILQNKDRFRAFLKEHKFNVPNAKSYHCKSDALQDIDWLRFPVIVKPTDSAGSKGVSRVDTLAQYESALDLAFSKSISGNIIVEDFIEKRGCSSDSDSFLKDGQWQFISFNAQRFDTDAINPYTPAAYTWPSTFSISEENYLKKELQRLIDLLHMRTSVFNIETRVSSNGVPYIMECTPRGGGNRLCEMLHYATGIDMITAQVRAAVGDSIDDIRQRPYQGHWAEIILHSTQDGFFDRLHIDRSIQNNIVECNLWVKKGDRISSFKGANDAIGTLVLHFTDELQSEHVINNINQLFKIVSTSD